MNNIVRWGVALAFLPLAACTNYNSTLATTIPQPQTPSSISVQDKKFIDQATSVNMYEVASGQLALDKSRSPRTRAYAQTVIDDHTMAQQQLGAIAQSNVVTPPAAMAAEQQTDYDALGRTTRNFDRRFFQQQTSGHQAAIELYQTEISSGYNNELRQYAQQVLPHLQQHLQMAQQGGAMPMARSRRRSATPASMPSTE